MASSPVDMLPSPSWRRKRRRKRKRKYSGKKINLTIKDADISVSPSCKEGGVNIVASDDVRKVTFHLENIPWDLALDDSEDTRLRLRS